jgi:hypothetical protein
MPGLRLNVFTFDDKQQRAANFHVRRSREAAESFFTEELRDRVTGLYGVAPGLESAGPPESPATRVLKQAALSRLTERACSPRHYRAGSAVLDGFESGSCAAAGCHDRSFCART